MRTLTAVLALATYISGAAPASAAVVGPSLQAKLNGLADTASVATVILAFNTTSGLNSSHLGVLQAAGINAGYTLNSLGMAGRRAVRSLAGNSAVDRSGSMTSSIT